MQENIDIKHATYLDYQVPCLCSNVQYVFAYPFPSSARQQSVGEYAMLTYWNQNTKMSDLLEQFQRIFPSLKASSEHAFTLSSGYILQNTQSISDVKKILNKKNIDGIQLFLDQVKSQVYSNQACLQQYIQQQRQIRSKTFFQVKFILPGENMHEITINGYGEEITSNYIEKLLREIDKRFGIVVRQRDIQNFVIWRNQRVLDLRINIIQNQMSSGDQVHMILFDRSRIFQRANSIKELLIYGSNEEDPIKFPFDFIKDETWGDIYRQYINSNMKMKVYLKIMDLIICEKDAMQKASQFFCQSEECSNITIVGHVITERHIFYASFEKLIHQNQAPSMIFHELSLNENVKSMVRNQIYTKVKQLKRDEQIKNARQLYPIYLYTCETKINDLTIYDHINKYLRISDLLTMRRSQRFNDWEYRYIFSLLKRLKLIKKLKKKTVYRGVNYIPPLQVGDTMNFQGFTSTSANKDISYTFPIIDSIKQQLVPLGYSLFIMKIVSGKEIAKYSAQKDEEQILIEPFSQFKIQKKELKKYKYQSKIYQFVVFTLKEIHSSPVSVKVNYILWIDDKFNEGKLIYKKIEKIKDSLVFKQFGSTIDFQEWMERNIKIFEDKSANILVISNMKRSESGGYMNPIAGLQALNELRRYSQKIPFILYIFNIESTMNHLENFNFSKDKNVHVCSLRYNLMEHIEKYTTVRFPVEKQEETCQIQ